MTGKTEWPNPKILIADILFKWLNDSYEVNATDYRQVSKTIQTIPSN